MDGRRTATRRQLISSLSSAAAAAGLAAAGIAVVGGAEPGRALGATAPTDADQVHEMLAAELLAIAVYDGVIGSGLLSPQVQRPARRVLSQEHAHVRALAPALGQLGGTMPPSPTGTAAVDKALADRGLPGRLAKLRTEHDCVSLLLDVEAVVEGSYFKAMSTLQNSGLQRLAAQIMANEAQHATAISEARRPGDVGQALPAAFVEGKS
jgi:hypothetical protein